MSYKDYLKKKKDYSGVLRDSSEREVNVEQTKQAQANRPIGPRQNVRAPEKTMAQKMLDKTAEFLGRTTGFDKLREKERQVNNVVKTANDLGVFRKIGDTVQGGFNKAFGNNKTAWGTDVEKRDKSEVIQPSFKYKGNIDLNSLPTVQNEDGSQSTVLSFSIQDERDGKETLIPQVVNGKIVSEDEAIKHYYETGKHLGKFDTIKEADKYAEKLHEEEEKRISKTNSKANPLLYKTTQRINEEQQEEKKEKLAKNVEARLPNGLVQQDQKDTWGQVLEKAVQNIQESNLEDTLNYAPKIGLAVGLGGKQGLEQAGQYYYETMPSHVDQGRWGEGISQMERNREIAKEQLIKEKGIGVINTEEYQHAGDSLFQQWSRDDQEKINKIIEEAPNYVSKKLAEQAPSFGNSTLGGAAGIVSPIASIGYFFGSSGQSYYEEALERGMDDEDAYLYSGIMATWESASDSAITAQNVNFLKSKITGKEINGNVMKLIGNQFVENAVQEAVTEPFQELMVGITGGKEYMQTSDLVPRMLDSGFWGGIQGALSGGLTGITASTFNNAQEATSYLRNKIQQQIEKNGKEKFAQDFIKGAQDTMSKSAKRMAEMSIDSSQLTEKQRTDIMRMINKPSSNLEQIKNAIQITQAWNEAVEGAYKNYRGTISDTSWKANVKNKAKEIERLSQTSNQSQNVSLKNVDENIKNMALGVAEERAKEQLEKNGQFKKRGNLTLGNYTINYTINENGEAKITKVTENVETQEIRPSTMENKALSESKQQTIQEEGKTAENATSQETEAKALPKGKKKSKLLNIKSSENITSQEVEQNIKNYLENNEILSEEDLDEKIKAEKDKKELERLQGLKDKIAEMRNSVTENNTKEETPEQKQRKSEILETIGKTEEEWNKMSQYGKERTLDNFSLDEITDEDRSLMLEENVANNEKIEKIEETEKQNINNETTETSDKKKLPRKAKLFFDNYTRKDIKRLIEEKGKNELLEDFDKSQNQQMDRAEFENELNKIVNKINKDNKKFKMPEDTQTNKVVEKATQNTNDLEEIKKESKKSKNEGDTRVYSHLKLGLESDFVDKEAQKTIAKIIPTPDGRYDVIHNDDKILESEEKISEEGIDEVYNNYIKKFDTGKEMTLDDVYDAEVMIQQYSYKGDSKKVLELLARQAIVVKMAGQKAQAASIMARGTKEGKLFYIEKGLQRYNAEHGENIKMNEKLVDKLLKSKTNKEVEKAIDKIYQDIGKQMPATMWDSLDSWRYFSMLFNPSTHLRNIGGNTGMHFLQAFKNNINGIMQDVYKKINPKHEQTVSFARGNLISKALNREYYKEIREFAKEDLAEVGDIDSYGSKYSETFKSEVDKYKKTLPPGFDQSAKFNEKVLEFEDKIFLEWEYQKSLGRYIAANGWNVENDIRVDENDSKEVADRKRKNLEKARKWAVKEALEATFHQKSDFATAVTNWEQKVVNNENRRISLAGTVGKVLLDSKLPFKKIPINVLKTAGAYSPVGLLTSTGGMLTDAIGEKRNINKEYNKKLNVLEEKLNTNEISQEIFDRRKNNLDEDRNTKIIDMYNNRFDKIAKGTAGTILAGIGAILSQSGLVRLTGADEDDEDEFNSEIAGEKKYSLVIGDEINIPIDSLAPASVPFLIGANFMQEFKKDTGLDVWERAKNAGIISLTSVVDPLVEVSFLQGITSSVKSFAYNENVPEGLQAFLFGLGLDYINQMVPAIGGKINKLIDPTVRDTSSAQKGAAGQLERTKNQMLSKLNSRLLAPKKDRWGNEISRNDTPLVDASTKVFGDNAFGRGFGRLLDAVSPTNPNYIKQLDKTEKELLDVSGKADKNVLPTQKTIDKKYKVDGKEYVLTDEEFRRSKETFGKTSKEMLDALVNSKDYKNLDDPKVKAELMNDIYSYAKQVSKEEYFKKHGLKFEVSSTQSVNDMYNTLTEIKKANGKVSDYFDYLVGVKKNELSGKANKLEYLQKMNLPDKIEKIIYENDVGTYQSVSKGADEDYNALKSITGNKVSNSYLDYVEKNSQGYFKDQKKEGGKGHQQKLEEFLNSSDLSNIERYYIYTMDGNTGYAKYLSKDQRAALRKAIENNQLNISEEKYNDIIKRLDKADNGG